MVMLTEDWIDLLQTIAIGIAVTLAVLILLSWIYFAYVSGATIDPDGYCSIKQFPYIQLCQEQKLNELIQEFVRNYTR